MDRWSRLPYSHVWSSGLVLIALCAVLTEIRHVRERRLRATAPSGIETILGAWQLTYEAEPVDEPRQLPIDLIDRGLPLSLQESYAAQRSDYHPARASRLSVRRHPAPIPAGDEDDGYRGTGIDEDRGIGEYVAPMADEQRDEMDGRNVERRAIRARPLEIHSGSPPLLQAPDRSGFQRQDHPGDATRESSWDSFLEKDHDVLMDVLQRMPPTYPNTRHRFPEPTRSAEIQSSFVTELRGEALAATSPPRHEMKVAQQEMTKASIARPASSLFPPPEQPAEAGSRQPYWAATRWTRSVAE